MAAMAESLDYEALKRGVLPAAHDLCLGTTSATVRVAAFEGMAALSARTDQPEAEAMLAVAAQVGWKGIRKGACGCLKKEESARTGAYLHSPPFAPAQRRASPRPRHRRLASMRRPWFNRAP